ncbi:hypothetical protein Lal_00042629 [Lupinus albus]|nr:hypothetical protein Lal_00042629 [Lupinus albus]
MITNIAECINGVLKGSRALPIVALVQTPYYRLNLWFVDHRDEVRFSLERERFTWKGESLGYTRGFSPEREMSRLGEKWHLGLVDTVRFSLEREGQS